MYFLMVEAEEEEASLCWSEWTWMLRLTLMAAVEGQRKTQLHGELMMMAMEEVEAAWLLTPMSQRETMHYCCAYE